MHWTAQCIQRNKVEDRKALSRILGTIWTRDQIKQMTSGKVKAVSADEIFIPLAQAVNPDLIDGLKKLFRVHEGSFVGGGEYQPVPGEEVVNLGDLPPEEFVQWANQATGVMKTAAEEFAKNERPVTLKEGVDKQDDPKLQRIRDQIAASKRYRNG